MAPRTNSVQFTLERSYTVRRPKFTLFRSVQYLDAAKLCKGSHTIELGRFEGGCCDCPVMGKIKGGKLVGIETPRCEKAIDMPPALKKRLTAASRQLAKFEKARWEDLPIKQIIASPAVRRQVIIIITPIDDCVETCVVMADGRKICMICCPKLGWCIGPSDPQLALF